MEKDNCIITKYWSHPVPCREDVNVKLRFHNGELIAVSECIFCGKVLYSRMIPTAPYIVENSKPTNTILRKQEKKEQVTQNKGEEL